MVPPLPAHKSDPVLVSIRPKIISTYALLQYQFYLNYKYKLTRMQNVNINMHVFMYTYNKYAYKCLLVICQGYFHGRIYRSGSAHSEEHLAKITTR
jgi:hypothetical protein